MRIVKRIIDTVTTVAIILLVALILALYGTELFGIRAYAVLSGSMEPNYHTIMKKNKTLIVIVAVALVACMAIAGTFAYHTNVQDSIKNVFTIGNVDIELDEEGGEPADPENPDSSDKKFTLIPNTTMLKDAKITVNKSSQDAYIFAVVAENCTAVKETDPETVYYSFSDYVDYSIEASTWTKLTGYENVYYIKYTAPEETPETDTVYM